MDIRQKLLRFYQRNPDVLYDMIRSAQNREVTFRYESGSFGKRPNTLENEGDVLQLVRRGVISLHMSVERWNNPLDLSTSLRRKQLDEMRIGWDLVIDLDSKDFEYSKYTAKLIVDLLRNYGIKRYYVKFSGGKGFHIAIPWESLPEIIELEEEIEVAKEFPELARTVASFIAYKIEDKLRKQMIYREGSVEEIIKKFSLDVLPENFSPFHVVEIDTILISSRHLFRMPYSLNEKTNLLSIPIRDDRIMDFRKEEASLDYYSYEGIPFLNEDLDRKEEARKLFLDAIVWEETNKLEKAKFEAIVEDQLYKKSGKDLSQEISDERKKLRICGKISEEYFPPCIKNILSGIEDGRKRAVFILINFLKHVGWNWEEIEEKLREWNENNPEPLKERYIEYQLDWHKRVYNKRSDGYLPPNCNRKEFYADMGICKPDEICKLIKNPVQYPLKKIKLSRGEE